MPVSSRLPKSSESTLPPDSKTSLASTTPPASAATSTQRRQAVVPRARAARETLDAEREHERRGERAERRREAEAIGQHEAREGRGADRVGVEREPAHHDPRAEHAPRRRPKQQHLEHAALHELELEGIEHGGNLIDTHSHYKQRRNRGLARNVRA